LDVPANLNLSILVVDDSPITIRITQDALRELGYVDVATASGGNTALEMMRTKRYDLVICDWKMEPMTGYDLLKHVRTAIGQTPFILMAAQVHIEYVKAAKKAGASGFIAKPLNAMALKAKIDAALDATHGIED
jgi:two-component system, chemotaxis family, chemotaxis protein CheY